MDSRSIKDMDPELTEHSVTGEWGASVIATLEDYIRIPNCSPAYDKDWEHNGYMERAVELFVDWIEYVALPNTTVEVLTEKGRTPLLLVDIAPSSASAATNVPPALMYGHLDKQPPFEGWDTDAGLGPYTPVIRDGKLYGRGGADDGYAIFSSILAVRCLIRQRVPHGRIFIIIEASEESGSPDLPFYMNLLGPRLGNIGLVLCLDSMAGDYERLWATTSLRGILVGKLNIQVLTEGVHSGTAGGIVPSTFRVARVLLSRLEDQATGCIIVPGLSINIPKAIVEEAYENASIMGDNVFKQFPFVDGMVGVNTVEDLAELYLNQTWRPSLSITGADGLPPCAIGGNVLLPELTLKLSIRLPPTLDPSVAEACLRDVLTIDPPFGCRVSLDIAQCCRGWQAPPMAKWLSTAVDKSSTTFFNSNKSGRLGCGGSIPFMDMLTKTFPKAQFFATGVLGPHSNAHGPNEFLDIDFSRRVTCAVAHVMGAYCEASVSQARMVVSTLQSSRLKAILGSKSAKDFAVDKFKGLLGSRQVAAENVGNDTSPGVRDISYARDVVADRDCNLDGLPLLELSDRINDLKMSESERLTYIRQLPLHPDTRLKLFTLQRLKPYEGEMAREIASSNTQGVTVDPDFTTSNNGLDVMIHSISSKAAYSMYQHAEPFHASHGLSPSKDVHALRYPHLSAAKGGVTDGIRPEVISFIRDSSSPCKSQAVHSPSRSNGTPASPLVSSIDMASSSPRILKQLREAPISSIKKFDIVQSLPVSSDQKAALTRALLQDSDA